MALNLNQSAYPENINILLIAKFKSLVSLNNIIKGLKI